MVETFDLLTIESIYPQWQPYYSEKEEKVD